MKLRSLAAAALAVLAVSVVSWAQASVDESRETAQVFVNAQSGADSNPGTQALPLKTITAAAALAAANNHKNVGTRVVILPGIYRESVTLAKSLQDTSAPITFGAQTNGTVTISGADVWQGWQAVAGRAGVYSHAWAYRWGLCPAAPSGPAEQDIVRRREMVFIKGSPLTEVLAMNQLVPGTFFVDELGGNLYLDPAAGVNLATAQVEVTTRQIDMQIDGRSNLVLRGLDFVDAGSCRWGTAAVYINGLESGDGNILVDSDAFNWNNGSGLRLGELNNVTVTHSVARHNGQAGLGGHQIKWSLWQQNDASFNNWRGAQGSYYGWNASGAHFMLLHDQTVNGLVAAYNQTHGIHWDTDNANVTASGLAATENLLAGAFVEKNEGPFLISTSAVCGGSPRMNSDSGLVLRNSESVTLEGDSLVDSDGGQLVVTGQAGGIMVTDWETGQDYNLVTHGLAVGQTSIEASAGQNAFGDGALGGSDWAAFTSTLVSDYNVWSPAETPAFVVPVPSRGTKLNLAGWQTLTGQDRHSQGFAGPAPRPQACQVAPDVADFWVLVNNSDFSVTRGQSVTITAHMVPVGYSGSVVVTSAPMATGSGLTGAWSAASIASGGAASFAVKTGSGTPPGTYPVTLMASGGGITRTVTVSVVVN